MQRATQRLITTRNSLLDATSAAKNIKKRVIGLWHANFLSEGKSLFGQWQPLAEYTQKDRAQKGYEPDTPILVRTGNLQKVLFGQMDNGVVSPQAITWNFQSENGAWILTHQHGHRNHAPFGPIPARRIYGFDGNGKILDVAVDITETWVNSIVHRYY